MGRKGGFRDENGVINSKKRGVCDSLSEGLPRHNSMGSQEEKLVEPKVLLETLPIITVKVMSVCLYVHS